MIPNVYEKVPRLQPITGLMPDPSELPEGCAFAPRCPHAMDECSQSAIDNIETETGHFVKCILAKKGGV